jgi:hypothetical protein
LTVGVAANAGRVPLIPTVPPEFCNGEPSVVLMVVRPAAVAAPVGSGSEDALIGWVACQKVPLTGCAIPPVTPCTGTAYVWLEPAAVASGNV